MATGQLILSDVLCFIANKLGNVPLKPLKKMLIDFYSVEDISKAKSQLLNDINSLDLPDKPPRVSSRHDGENRQVRETDDIFTLINFVDEHKLVNSLPTYVTANPDKMPTLRLFDGDLSFLLARLDKLEAVLDNHGSMLAAICNDGHQAKRPTFASVVAAKDVINNNRKPAGPVAVSTGKSNRPTGDNQAGLSKPIPTGAVNENINNRPINDNNNKDNNQLIHSDGALWSDRMNSSSIQKNQRLRLVSDQTAGSENESTDEHFEQPFVEYVYRRSARKRRRESPHEAAAEIVASKSSQVKRGPLIIGSLATSGGSTNARGIDAANPPIKKSVFCVDNVNPRYSVDDVVDFVSKLHVNVVSCFEVKPRRRYSDYGENPVPRKAFRLCIHSSDCDLLLDASKWPAHVVIYDYFFKKKNQTYSKTNEHNSCQENLQDQSHPSTVIGLARLEPLQHQPSLPWTASASLLPSPLNSGLSGINDGDVGNDNENERKEEDATDMDATILTQSPDHGAL